MGLEQADESLVPAEPRREQVGYVGARHRAALFHFPLRLRFQQAALVGSS